MKRKHNWKSRQVVRTVVDNRATKKIKLDLNVGGRYDESNELVLPSEKRPTKIKKGKAQITRILSKKHRKRLEKIVEKKKKKDNRTNLLDALSKVQASEEELMQLTSIASVQTRGLKKFFLEQKHGIKKVGMREKIVSGEVKPNSIRGSLKQKRISDLLGSLDKIKEKLDNPNMVRSDSSSEEDEIEQVTSIKEHLDETTESAEDKRKQANREMVLKPQESNATKDVTEIMKHKPAVFVEVERKEEIQTARLKLPILGEEQQIMETINENSIVILAGETGSGKTTQVPQFLYEAGYALEKTIGITEPRRVAAISMSKRVAEELNLTSKEISYLIRFEGNVSDDTKIKFMTDGVLLKELKKDFLLTNYSVIILDEAHERSVYTDTLIGMLSRVVPLRHKRGIPLKLIIMSATLRLEDFTDNGRLFKRKPPVIKVEARQFPVTVHFNKRTNDNYLKEALNKTVKIHTKLPDGGILIFVTGQLEVRNLVGKLRKMFPFRQGSKVKTRKVAGKRGKKKITPPQIDLDDYSLPGDVEEDEEVNGSDLEFIDDDDEENDVSVVGGNGEPMWVLPLYAMLPSEKQSRVFEAPPAGCRLCIVSTNVAETSLTIPNVKYVVDTGKTKVKLYDKTTGVSSYVVSWTCKASAEQRAGRAGRTGPGHCYRLYSSAVYNDIFQKYSVPEIQRRPVDDLYLQLKCMHVDKVQNFPFPSAPDLLQLKTAESRLEILGALAGGKVTELGRAVAKFPLLPRYGKMLTLSFQQDMMPYTICLVAALSVQEVLEEKMPPNRTGRSEECERTRAKWAGIRRQWAGTGNSLLLGDPMVLLKAVGAAEYANSRGKLEKFCEEHGLRRKAIVEIRKLRVQLTNEIRIHFRDADFAVDPQMPPPNDLQAKLLRQILLAGMGDQVARKMNLSEVKEGEDKRKFKYAYFANNLEEPVFLHQSSVLKQFLPEYVIYQEIYETNKMYMRGVTAVEPEWLPSYVPTLCNLSEPLLEPEPSYDPADGRVKCYVAGSFGRRGWPLPNVRIDYPKNVDCYRWFSRYFLEGKIFPKLEKYSEFLSSKPSLMIKSWAKLQPRTESFLKALLSKQICTKEDLVEAWREEPQYLLEAYLKWTPETVRMEVTKVWPPLDNTK